MPDEITYECGKCGQKRTDIPPEDLRMQRGYLWHLPCADVTGGGLIAFPCGAKLTPSTILEANA
jgi:hypothetical protein